MGENALNQTGTKFLKLVEAFKSWFTQFIKENISPLAPCGFQPWRYFWFNLHSFWYCCFTTYCYPSLPNTMKVNRIQLFFCFFLLQTKFIHLSCVVVVTEKSDRDIWNTNKNIKNTTYSMWDNVWLYRWISYWPLALILMVFDCRKKKREDRHVSQNSWIVSRVPYRALPHSCTGFGSKGLDM